MEEIEGPAAALPQEAAAMLEGALARLGADMGAWELWVKAENLRIRRFRLTREGGRDSLEPEHPSGS